METFTALFANIDSLGKDFTGAVYHTLAALLAPAMECLLVLYLIVWGFRFWQGRGDTNLVTMVFKLVRIAVIFAVATQWGPMQHNAVKAIEGAPFFVSSTMLNKIVNPRNGKAITASLKIEAAAVDNASPPPTPTAEETLQPPKKKQLVLKDPNDPSSAVLSSYFQAALIWIAAALFVGYAAALFLFSKIALWVLLALAPVFIILLMFPVSSRFFSGWLSGVIQTVLIPVFLYVFLSFYIFSTYDIIVAFMNVANDREGVLTMREAGPFVLFCFVGLFLLIQIVPLTRRVSMSSEDWFANTYERVGSSIRAGVQAGSSAVIKGFSGNTGATNGAAAPGQFGTANAVETILRETQDRNAAINRQNRNR